MVIFMLDAVFTRELQRKFSKNGREGKRAFNKTMHCRYLLS